MSTIWWSPRRMSAKPSSSNFTRAAAVARDGFSPFANLTIVVRQVAAEAWAGGEHGSKVNPMACGSASIAPGTRGGMPARTNMAGSCRGLKIRAELMKQLKQAAVSKIVIERPHKVSCDIQSARPGGDRQEGRRHREAAQEVAELTESDVVINIVEIRSRSSTLSFAESIAQQLERRVVRRAMKRAVQSTMRLGAGGIRINARAPGRRRDRPHGGYWEKGAYARAGVDYGSPPPLRTAPAASRCGSSRVRFWSTTRWRRTRRWRKARPASAPRCGLTVRRWD